MNGRMMTGVGSTDRKQSKIYFLLGRGKRMVGYSSTFGLLGYFLIPVIPATAAIVVGMAGGVLIAKALGRRKS